MQVNEYGNNGIEYHIQKICMSILPRWITTKKNIVRSKPTYHSKYRYNIHKRINTTMNVTTIQWNNNPYI